MSDKIKKTETIDAKVKKGEEKKHTKKVVVEPLYTTNYVYINNQPTVICNLEVKKNGYTQRIFKGVATCDPINTFDLGTGELMAALKAEKKMQAWVASKMNCHVASLNSRIQFVMNEVNELNNLSNAARKSPAIPLVSIPKQKIKVVLKAPEKVKVETRFKAPFEE